MGHSASWEPSLWGQRWEGGGGGGGGGGVTQYLFHTKDKLLREVYQLALFSSPQFSLSDMLGERGGRGGGGEEPGHEATYSSQTIALFPNFPPGTRLTRI